MKTIKKFKQYRDEDFKGDNRTREKERNQARKVKAEFFRDRDAKVPASYRDR